MFTVQYRYKNGHAWVPKGTFETLDEAKAYALKVIAMYTQAPWGMTGEVDVYDNGCTYGWQHIAN
jgi:hypothetical protein